MTLPERVGGVRVRGDREEWCGGGGLLVLLREQRAVRHESPGERASLVSEEGSEAGGGVDGNAVGEAGEVGVSGDEDGGGGLGEGDEVVVVGVDGVHTGWGGRVGMLLGLAAEQGEELAGLGRGDAGGDLGVGQDAGEFGEQGGGDDEFVVAVEPGAQELGGGPGPGQDRGDQDVGVQDGP